MHKAFRRNRSKYPQTPEYLYLDKEEVKRIVSIFEQHGFVSLPTEDVPYRMQTYPTKGIASHHFGPTFVPHTLFELETLRETLEKAIDEIRQISTIVQKGNIRIVATRHVTRHNTSMKWGLCHCKGSDSKCQTCKISLSILTVPVWYEEKYTHRRPRIHIIGD